jgi:NAD-dependent dihydropyrimidine dehydrogenase PreA subunit
MKKTSPLKVLALFSLLLAITASLSHVSTRVWGGKPESLPEKQDFFISAEMTVAAFGKKNHIPNPVLRKVFDLRTKEDKEKTLNDFGLTQQQILSRVDKAMALASESETKNWIKIPTKFGLWFIFLGTTFFLMRRGNITSRTRKTLYLLAIILFGIILGADPSPMGTVKDAIALYGAKGVFFKPRMIALAIFLTLVLLANKFICGWGCQLGALQDLIFRLNRNAKDTKGVLRQYKPSFAVTNSIRILFFIIFSLVAFLWATDIVDPIDPFKIYKPAMITLGGWFFIGAILLGGLFVYRPWCQLFCPFGLVGWFVEKISIFKIRVNYESCTACGACSKVCPSTVMDAILKQDRTVPDCFACGTCIQICPTNSIQFQAGKRLPPPADKF